MKKINVLIIGAGAFGTALAHVLEKNKRLELHLWDTDPKKVPKQQELTDLLPNAQVIFFAVCSWHMTSALEMMKDLDPDTVLISCAKGIDASKQSMDDLITTHLPKQRFGVLGGAMIAEELNKDQKGMAVFASTDMNLFTLVDEIFEGTNVYISHSEDVKGLALAGVLKNVYAVLLGMVDGLNLGSNTKGFLTSQCMTEMLECLPALGGEPEVVMSAAGLGDLVATSFSEHSRNRKIGEEFISHGECCEKSEGVTSIKPLGEMLGGELDAYPLLKSVYEVVVEKKDPKQIIESLL